MQADYWPELEASPEWEWYDWKHGEGSALAFMKKTLKPVYEKLVDSGKLLHPFEDFEAEEILLPMVQGALASIKSMAQNPPPPGVKRTRIHPDGSVSYDSGKSLEAGQ